MANVEKRHHRSHVVNFVEDGSFIDTERDAAEVAMAFWDLDAPIDAKVTNAIDVNLDHSDDSVRVGDGVELLGITASNEALVAINTDNVGLFRTADFTESRQITDVSMGGSQTDDLLVAVNQSLPTGTNNIGSIDVDTLPSLPPGANNVGNVNILNQADTVVDPRTDSFVHRQASGVDINAATATESFTAPDRADAMTVHAETSGAAHVEVRFQDGAGSTVTQRDDSDNPDFAVAGAGDIFVTVDVASPNIEVAVVDDSGAANSTDYNIYCR